MRFDELRLLAFGPFTDESLDLRGGAPGGLHVIYGPNEAGKSTSLRAVKNFLFGMPRRSPDAHVHPLPRLAVGATISEGEHSFNLIRVKRDRDNLLDANGSVLTTDPLPDLLGHLDERSFSLRFGLDQVELEKGAEALLGGSEEGLFAAGTAGADARNLLRQLEEEASALYLARGKLPLLNRQNAEYEQAISDLRRSERPVEKWTLQQRAYENAVQEVASIQKKRSLVRGELRRLNRLKAVMSDLLEWQKADLRSKELKHVPDLPADALDRRIQISTQLKEAQVEARRVSEDLSIFEQELAQLPEVSALSDIDDEQLQLGARVGTAISARKDLPKRKAALLEQERQIAALLRELGRNVEPSESLSVARQMLVGAEVSGSVNRLIMQYSGLINAVDAAKNRISVIEEQRKKFNRNAEKKGANERLSKLEALLVEAQQGQKSLVEYDHARKSQAQRAAHIERLRLQLRCETRWQVIAKHLPPRAQFEAIVSQVGATRRALIEQKKEEHSYRERLFSCEKKQAAEQELPSDQQLKRARKERDAAILGNPASRETSPAAIMELVRAADLIADELRQQSERVYAAEMLRREMDELTERLARATQAVSDLVLKERIDRQPILQLERALSVAIPEHEADIFRWYSDMGVLIETEVEFQGIQQDLELKHATRVALEERIQRELGEGAVELTLPGLVARLEQVIRDNLKLNEREQHEEARWLQLGKDHEAASAELQRAGAALENWRKLWAKAVLPLGLMASTSVERAQEVLATLQRIERLVETATNYEGRILGMQRDTEALERDISRYTVGELFAAVGEHDTVDRAIRLQECIRVARRQRDERERIRSLIDERRMTLATVHTRLKSAEGQIKVMLSAAGVSTEQELAEVERLAKEKRGLALRINELFERIRVASDGSTIEELLAEAEPWNGAVRRLIAAIDDLDQESSELEDALKQAESDAEGTRLGLLSYQTDDVAILRQIAVERAASARASLRKYLVVRAAHLMLDEQVTRYAERFSGPIASRASELFRRVTLGKYSRLSVGVGERSLRCVRQGHEVEVSELSRGTRAQLYFALRLASLERHFEQHAAVPLIFDDLFVDFDDDRTTAAFEILSELAERVQILYFTHLARDVEKAHDAVSKGRLFTHVIGVR